MTSLKTNAGLMRDSMHGPRAAWGSESVSKFVHCLHALHSPQEALLLLQVPRRPRCTETGSGTVVTRGWGTGGGCGVRVSQGQSFSVRR